MNFLEFKDEKQTFSKVLKTKIVILPFFFLRKILNYMV